MSPYLWSTFLAEEQQSRWTHALVCLYNSRQLQSYWLVLCWDHSNNQAVSHQTALDWASEQRNISNTLCLFCWISLVSNRDNNADILVSKGCLALSVITLQSQEVNQKYSCNALLCQKANREKKKKNAFPWQEQKEFIYSFSILAFIDYYFHYYSKIRGWKSFKYSHPLQWCDPKNVWEAEISCRDS